MTIATICVFMLYLLGINMYILTFGYIDLLYSKLIYCSFSLAIIYYCIVNIYSGFKSELHKALITLCLGGVGANFVLLITYFVFDMRNFAFNFCTFNGIELITAACLLVSGKKRGLFKA